MADGATRVLARSKRETGREPALKLAEGTPVAPPIGSVGALILGRIPA